MAVLPEGFVEHDGFMAPFYATGEVVEIITRGGDIVFKKGRNPAWLWRDDGSINASDIVGYKPPS